MGLGPRGLQDTRNTLTLAITGRLDARKTWEGLLLLYASTSGPGSWKSDCLRKVSRAHLGHVVELS